MSQNLPFHMFVSRTCPRNSPEVGPFSFASWSPIRHFKIVLSLLRDISQIIVFAWTFSPTIGLKFPPEDSGVLLVPHLNTWVPDGTQHPTGQQCSVLPLIRALCLHLKGLRFLQLYSSRVTLYIHSLKIPRYDFYIGGGYVSSPHHLLYSWFSFIWRTCQLSILHSSSFWPIISARCGHVIQCIVNCVSQF